MTKKKSINANTFPNIAAAIYCALLVRYSLEKGLIKPEEIIRGKK